MNDGENGNLDDYSGMIPDDFPRMPVMGALPGTQPKFLATLYNGRYYLNGCTPPEVFERWRICESAATRLSVKLLESKQGNRSHMTEKEILEQYYIRLVETKWTSVNEACWIIRRAAQTIGWDATDIT